MGRDARGLVAPTVLFISAGFDLAMLGMPRAGPAFAALCVIAFLAADRWLGFLPRPLLTAAPFATLLPVTHVLHANAFIPDDLAIDMYHVALKYLIISLLAQPLAGFINSRAPGNACPSDSRRGAASRALAVLLMAASVYLLTPPLPFKEVILGAVVVALIAPPGDDAQELALSLDPRILAALNAPLLAAFVALGGRRELWIDGPLEVGGVMLLLLAIYLTTYLPGLLLVSMVCQDVDVPLLLALSPPLSILPIGVASYLAMAAGVPLMGCAKYVVLAVDLPLLLAYVWRRRRPAIRVSKGDLHSAGIILVLMAAFILSSALRPDAPVTPIDEYRRHSEALALARGRPYRFGYPWLLPLYTATLYSAVPLPTLAIHRSLLHLALLPALAVYVYLRNYLGPRGALWALLMVAGGAPGWVRPAYYHFVGGLDVVRSWAWAQPDDWPVALVHHPWFAQAQVGGAAGLFLSLRLLEGRGREARLAPLVLLYALLSHGVEYLLVLAYLALRGVRAPSIVAPSVAAAALAAPFPHLYVGGLYGAYLATVPISAVAAWTAPRLGLSRLVAAASRAVTAELVALYLLLMVGWLVDPPYLRMSRWVWGDPVVGVTRYRQLPPSKLPVLAGLPGYAALHALVHGVYVPRALMSLIIVGVVGYHTVWVYGYFSERFVGLAMPPYRPSP